MNAPIQAIYSSGQNLYAVLVNPDGTVWNQNLSVWETYNSAHWPQYAVVLTEYTGSGFYRAAYPIAEPDALSTDIIYTRVGGTPALGDTPASNLYQSQGANVGAVGNYWQSAQNMAFALGTQQLGAIVGTPVDSKTLATDLTNTELDAYAGRVIIMTSGTLIQQASPITAYDGTTFTLTITGFPSGSTPANTDTFVIV